jgi:hypothetical protein
VSGPGGGGGGAEVQTFGNEPGGAGFAGQVSISYTAPATAEALLLSIAGAAGVDNITGKAFPAGYAFYGASNTSISMQLQGTVPFLLLSTGVVEEAQAGNLQAILAPSAGGPSESMVLALRGPQGSVHVDFAEIFLGSAAKDGSFNAGGTLVYVDSSAAQHDYLIWGSSGLQVFSDFPGDTNAYRADELRQVNTTTATINSTSFTQFTTTVAVGVGTYEIDMHMHLLPAAAAGAPEFQLAATVGAGALLINYEEFDEGTPPAPGVMKGVTSTNTFSGVMEGATFTGVGRHVHIWGSFVITTAGSIGWFAATTVAADTFQIQQYNMNLRPVNG